MKPFTLLFSILVILLTACTHSSPSDISNNEADSVRSLNNGALNKIKILNVATFHMGFTNDANKTEFDEFDKENHRQVHEIAKKLATFKPTLIVVEREPQYNKELQAAYAQYLSTPDMHFRNPSEIELLAFEVGRLSGTKRITGIDHQLQYNYRVGDMIKNTIDSLWYSDYNKNATKFHPEINVNIDSLPLSDKLKLMNRPAYRDFSITINADILTYAGTENGFEGADEATKFYQRNLRMYSNFNRIQLTPGDRVFILMGASHTAFFHDFISRNPKFELVNTFDYLN